MHIASALRITRDTGVPLGALLLGLLAPGAEQPAEALTIIGPANTASKTKAACKEPATGKWWRNCTVDAFYSKTPVKADSGTFARAFANWNDLQPDDRKWTLVEGALPEDPQNPITLTVDIFRPETFLLVGGLEFRVMLSDFPGRDSILWSQSLISNYQPGRVEFPIDPPLITLDTASFNNLTCGGRVFCDPVYPYQYPNFMFYDFPKGRWTRAFFDAQAMLSRRDFNKRELTVFGGINWGFRLSAQLVPEPGAWAMMIAGFGLVGVAMRRRRRSLLPVPA